MRITGQLIEVKPAGGNFVGNDGGNVEWSNVTVRIFDGREVVALKVKKDAQPAARALMGREGQTVTVEVDSPRDLIPTESFTVHEDASV